MKALITALVLALLPSAGYGQCMASPSTDTLDTRSVYPYHNPLSLTLGCTLPMLGLSTLYNLHNRQVADARKTYVSTFHNRYDDYLQFAPIALQLGLHVAGVPGRSQHTMELLTANALSTAVMMSIVTATKTITHVRRPDNSASNSFPSGHTAMAFASATMLAHEYGRRYPWLAGLGYASATGVGLGRLINNRHWIGDVAVGAVVGVLSAELGYWLSDRLWRSGQSYQSDERRSADRRLSVWLPAIIAWQGNTQLRQVGVGLRWQWGSSGYFAKGLALLELAKTDLSLGISTRSVSARGGVHQLSIGKAWFLPVEGLTLDTSLGGAYTSDHEVYPLIAVAPCLRLSEVVALRLDLGYSLRRQWHEGRHEGATYRYEVPRWTLGFGLELYP